MTSQDQRTLGAVYQIKCFLHIGRRRTMGWAIAFHPDRAAIIFPIDRGLLSILGDIDQNWTWTTSTGDKESLTDHLVELTSIRHQVIVLGDRQGNSSHIRLLKGIIADKTADYLAFDKYYLNKIHHSSGNPSYQVG